uniref:Alkylated DNA repair dioxygenase n=1 Tax=Marseillevirus LCMAC101 TaxID=2506602 RepID=A0A481YTT1_9VIRU|nr:MAG: alkylated DNA repair dioxygenase [Marseillevirus LCMAC101]
MSSQQSVIIYKDKYWSFIPKLIPLEYFDILYKKLYKKTGRYPIKMRGNVFTSRRRSCTYTNNKDGMLGYTYEGIPRYKWRKAPKELLEIRDLVGYYASDQSANVKFDYVLCHIYEDGSDYIGFHSDHEALETPIVSVSLGPTEGSRKFRFRKIGETKGWEEEFDLVSGDVLIMHGRTNKREGCQRVYKHTVPSTKKKVGSRINLTFRQFE